MISDKIFKSIFYSLTLVVSVTVILVSLILTLSFESIAVSLVSSSLQDSLSQIRYSLTFMNKTATSLALQIYRNAEIRKLFLSQTTTEERVSGVNRLVSYGGSVPFLQGVYVYNSAREEFYSDSSQGALFNRDDFFDQDFVQLLSSGVRSDLATPVARLLPDGSHVFTYILETNTSDSAVGGNVVVVNVAEEWIKNTINVMSSEALHQILLIDQSGHVLLSNQQVEEMSPVIRASLLDWVGRSSGAQPSFLWESNGEKFWISTVLANEQGWKFVRVLPYGLLIDRIVWLRVVTLVSALVFLALGSAVTLFVSRRLYRPIRRIQEELTDLEVEVQQAKHLKRDVLLKGLLSGETVLPARSATETILDTGLQITPSGWFYVVVGVPDGFRKYLTSSAPQERETWEKQVLKALRDCGEDGFQSDAARTDDQRYVLVLNQQTTDGEFDTSAVARLVAAVQAKLEGNGSPSLSFAVSSLGSSLGDLPSLYAEAKNRVRQRFFAGPGSLLLPVGVEEEPLSYPQGKEKLLVDALLQEKKTEAERVFDEFLELIRTSDYDQFYLSILRLTTALSVAIETVEKGVDHQLGIDLPSFLTTLSEAESEEEVRLAFGEIFGLIVEGLGDRKGSRMEEVATAVVNFIDAHHSNPGITINTLADNLGMTAGYLGRLIKKSMGKSFAEYMNDYRMDLAEDLLVSTDLTINEIAEKVGFANFNYFYTLFKKRHGFTAKEFRRKQRPTSA